MKKSWLAVLLTILFLNSCSGEIPANIQSDIINPEVLITGDTATEVGPNVRFIFRDSKNNFWFATDGTGVFNYSGNILRKFTTSHGLISDYIWKVAEGKDGKIWFRSRDGICYYNAHNFITVNAEELMPANYRPEKMQLLFDEYFISGEQLYKMIIPETSPILSEVQSRFDYDVYSSLIDRRGRLWFGTCTAGVCYLFNGKITWLTHPDLGAPVRTLFEDRNGIIWIGNNGYGLLKHDPSKNAADATFVMNVTKKMNLDNPEFRIEFESKTGTLARVWSITDDQKGNLWIASIDNGVWKYDGHKLVNYNSENTKAVDAAWTVYRDKQGRIWLGTDGGGVMIWNGNGFEKWIK